MWNESHDTLSVFVLDDFGNRLESSNNHVTRWETNGVFFCLNPAVSNTEKSKRAAGSSARTTKVRLQGQHEIGGFLLNLLCKDESPDVP